MRKIPVLFATVALIVCTNFVKAQQNALNGSGNVGIGTTSPNTALEIRRGSGPGLGPILRLTGGGTTGSQTAIDMTAFDPGTGVAPSFRMITTDAGDYSCRIDFQIKTGGAYTSPVETKMTLSPQGNLGIGVPNPFSKLQTLGNIAATNTPDASQFVQLWADNAVIWKSGTQHGGLRFGSATDLGAGNYSEKMRIMDDRIVLGPEFHTQGWGNKLDFGWNSNSDPMYIGRYNVANDVSELRLSFSDNAQADDRFVIGYTDPNGTYNSLMNVNGNGIVSIGAKVTNETGYKLFVETGIRSRKVKVDALTWADYVFNSNYRLRPLSEVEQYIKENGHLPEVPSEEEVKKEGIDLGGNQAMLLKKIEELTLYVIEQNKRQESQDKLIQEQNKLLQAQQQRLETLEKTLKEK
jgi:hypothetical protein